MCPKFSYSLYGIYVHKLLQCSMVTIKIEAISQNNNVRALQESSPGGLSLLEINLGTLTVQRVGGGK